MSIPKNAKRKADNHLAEGEVTGHYHDTVGDGVAVFEDGNKVILDAPHGADVTHQEHKTITLPPGEYDRIIVREYDHAEEEARKVED